MSDDLYEVLGVSRDADKDTIKKAFRKAASDAHPDRGGDSKRMAMVNKAHDVLMDDKRREHYDATGRDTEKQSLDDQCIGKLRGMMLAVVEAAHSNPVNQILATLNNELHQLSTMKAAAGKKIARYERAKAALKRKGGGQANVFAVVFDQTISETKQQMARMDVQAGITKRALEIMRDYEWEGAPDEPMMQMFGSIVGAQR